MQVLAGIASFGIGHIGGAFPSWRYIFLIWGAITFLWGIVILFFLPDSPVKAKFLSEDERKAAIDRIKENETGIENKHWKKDQVLRKASREYWYELTSYSSSRPCLT